MSDLTDAAEFLGKRLFQALGVDEAHLTESESVEQLRHELVTTLAELREAEAMREQEREASGVFQEQVKHLTHERDENEIEYRSVRSRLDACEEEMSEGDEKANEETLLAQQERDAWMLNSSSLQPLLDALADARKWLGRASVYVADPERSKKLRKAQKRATKALEGHGVERSRTLREIELVDILSDVKRGFEHWKGDKISSLSLDDTDEAFIRWIEGGASDV